MALLLVVGLLVAGCTTHKRRSGTPITSSTSKTISVGGDKQHPLTMTISPGEVSTAGTVSTSAASTEAPALPYFTAAGPVREVDVSATLVKPVTLSFAAGVDHADDLPVILHFSGGHWNVIAVGDAGGTATAERTTFSPHLAGWFRPGDWLSSAADSVGRWATDRTDPPKCSGSLPSWAALTSPSLDMLLACGGSGSDAKGAPTAVLHAKDNRGLVLQLDLDPAVKDVDVEFQPQAVRALIRAITRSANGVLIAPGDQLTIASGRPVPDRTVRLDPRLSSIGLFATLLVQVADLAEGSTKGAVATVAGVVRGLDAVHECSGLKSRLLLGKLPSSLGDVTGFITDTFGCLAKLLSDPKAALAIAYEVVAAQSGVTTLVAQSDRAFSPEVERISGKLLTVGKLAGQVLKVLTLAKLAYTVYNALAEEIGRERSGGYDPAVVSLDLRAPSLAELIKLGRAECTRQSPEPEKCATGKPYVKVSTADPSYAYSGPAAEGYGGAIFRRDASGWKVVYDLGGGLDSCQSVTAIPTRVGIELGACFGPEPLFAYAEQAGGTYGVAAVDGLGSGAGSLPATLDETFGGEQSSSPAGWLGSTDRLLVEAHQVGQESTHRWVVADVRTGTEVGEVDCQSCRMAVGGESTVASLEVPKGGAAKVVRYDTAMHQVSSAVIRGIPPTNEFERLNEYDLLAARAEGIVIALPGDDGTGGTAAYGGPQRIATVDWSGTLTMLKHPSLDNVAIEYPAISPDGRRLAFDAGVRGGACSNYHEPHVVDLATGRMDEAAFPAVLKDGEEVYSRNLHWVSNTTLSFSWENSGMNGDWNSPCDSSNHQVPPRVYNWKPGSPPVAAETNAVFAQTLSDGRRLVVHWEPPLAGHSFEWSVAGKRMGSLFQYVLPLVR